MNDNKKLRKCFKCGLCRYQCPVYSVNRNDALSPKGKLLAAGYQENNATALLDLADIYRNCTLCKHCAKTCPGEIDVPETVINNREKLNRILPNGTYERLVKNIREIGTPYNQVAEENYHRNGADNTEFLLFLGCTARIKLPDIARSVIGFLDQIGLKYSILKDEQCCGNILYNTGYIEESKNQAKKNAPIFNKYKKILTLCPGCYNMLNNYKNMTSTKYEVFHIAQLINSMRKEIEGTKDNIYFHVPCHLYNTGEFEDVYANLISMFENASSSLDVAGSTRCCGAGGAMLSTNEGFVKERMDITFNDIKGKTVVTSCPFCYTSFKKFSTNEVVYITDKLKIDTNSKINIKALTTAHVKTKKLDEELNSSSFLKWTVTYKLKNIIKV